MHSKSSSDFALILSAFTEDKLIVEFENYFLDWSLINWIFEKLDFPFYASISSKFGFGEAFDFNLPSFGGTKDIHHGFPIKEHPINFLITLHTTNFFFTGDSE